MRGRALGGPGGGRPGWGRDPVAPRRFEELTNLIRTIRNAMKIRDVTKCLEEFELLGRAYSKAKSIVDKEGVPRFYVRLLADLEDYLNEVCEPRALARDPSARTCWPPLSKVPDPPPSPPHAPARCPAGLSRRGPSPPT